MELGQSIDGICQALDQHGHIIDVADVSAKMKLRLKSSADIFEIRYMWSWFICSPRKRGTEGSSNLSGA